MPDADELTSDELAEMTRTEALAVRIAAARALAQRGDGRAFPVLLEGLSGRHFRYPSLEGLRFLRDHRAGEPAAKIMNSVFSGAFERTQAAGVLVALGEPRGGEFLMERLRRRKRDDDRGLAIELAAEVGLHDAVPELERIAEDRADIFRGAALKALLALEPRRFERVLCAVARDEQDDPDVRSDALEAISRLPGEQPRRAMEDARTSSSAEVSELAGRLLADRAD